MEDNIFYLYLQKKLLERADENNEIEFHKAKHYVSLIRLDRTIRWRLLKNAQKLGLIEIYGYKKIKVLDNEKCQK